MSQDTPPKPRQGKRNRRRRKSPQTVEQRAARVLREISDLAWALARRKGVAPSEVAELGELDLRLTFTLGRKGRNDNRSEAAERLIGDLEQRLDAMLRAAVAFRRGHVFDHLEASPDGEGTAPPQAQSIFTGYTSVGRPRWQLFTNVCLERGEERVDRLYSKRPEVIALVQSDEELNAELFESFDPADLGHRVRGQVAAGLIPASLDPRDADAPRIAISCQVVELASGSPGHRLRLNIIGLSDEALLQAAVSGSARGPAEALRRTFKRRGKELAALGKRLHAIEDEAAREAEGRKATSALLHGLRGDVERVFRPVQRRTKHAQSRHIGGERPTGHAMSDLRSATSESVYRDSRRGTWVVLGPKGRAHIFAPKGRHVTSLRLASGELERKTTRGRWEPVAPERARATLKQLRAASDE